MKPRPLSTAHPSHLLKAAGIMGALTSLSRLFGFARDCLIAAFYGTSATAQAFVVAFRIPNLLRDMLGEGAANAAFVPVFSRIRAVEGEAASRELAQAVWVRVLTSCIIISVVGILASGVLVRIVAPGFSSDPGLFNLTVRLTRILFPFIGLMGVAAFFMGLLNSANHFASPSLGPVLLNISMIVGIFLWRPDGLGLCWGVLVGGFIQLTVQWPVLRRLGFKLRLAWTSHPGVFQIQRLLIPRMIGSGVYQLSVLVDTIFASFTQLVGKGGVASLYFAHRFLHLPLALFGISVAQAALPSMASSAAANDIPQMKRTCILSLRSSLFIAIPSGVGLMVLAHPIIQTMLQRGAFSKEATAMTAGPLMGYALGLGSLCAVKVLANTLYALHDTWTPVRSAAAAFVMNVVLNSILIFPLGLSGLAVATSVSSMWNHFQLDQAVRRRIGEFPPSFKEWVVRVVICSAGMGAVAYGIWTLGNGFVGLSSTWAAFVLLLTAIVCSIASFFGFGILLQVEETHQVIQWLRKALRR